jgi:hypothetical protein
MFFMSSLPAHVVTTLGVSMAAVTICRASGQFRSGQVR